MTEWWLLVAAGAVSAVGLKAAGPVLLGGRDLPPRASGVVALLAPSLLAALIATQTLGDGRSLAIDARVLGLAVAALALALRAPVLLAVVLAAATTAVARALG